MSRPPRLRVALSPIHGRGVFARDTIAEGALIGTYQGRPTRRDGRYVLWVEEAAGLVGRQGDRPLKFLNHSPLPNAEFDGFDLYALRTIAVGEEITFHYGADWDEDQESKPSFQEKS